MTQPPIRRPHPARRAVAPVVTAVVAALGIGTTGCSEMITMDFRDNPPDLGAPTDFAALADQIDIKTNRIPEPMFSLLQSDLDSFDPSFGLDPVQWLAESPSGAAAVDRMMAAFYLPLTDDAAITDPDLEAWFNEAVASDGPTKDRKAEAGTLAAFQNRLAQAWNASPAIAGLTPPAIQYLKPADAAAFSRRGAELGIAFQVATGKATFGDAMAAIEALDSEAFVHPDLGRAAEENLRALVTEINAAVAKRSGQAEIIGRVAQRSGTTVPAAAPVPPDRPLPTIAREARFIAALTAVAAAPTPAPAAGR